MEIKKFDYIDHYKKDAREFDYFEERKGATAHDERRVHEYIERFSRIKSGNLLDIGSGSAWAADMFTKKGVIVTSFDIAQNNVGKALRKVQSELHSGVTGDSFNLPFKSGSFDNVLASEVIEHVPDPEAFVKELFRAVKPGGSLYITTPYKEKLVYCLCIHCNNPTPLHGHIHSFDEKILTGLYNGDDLEKTEWKTFGNKVLIFLRTYTLLRFLPFALWKAVDKTAAFFYNKPAHIIVEYRKKAK